MAEHSGTFVAWRASGQLDATAHRDDHHRGRGQPPLRAATPPRGRHARCYPREPRRPGLRRDLRRWRAGSGTPILRGGEIAVAW